MRGARLHGLHSTVVGPDRMVDYVYPGTIDVLGSDGGRIEHGRDAQHVPLGQVPAEPALTAELALDPARWSWKPSTTSKAQIWVRHVFAADAAYRNQSYESEGEVVLVWHGLPVREAELSLLAAGFRASLATWRAPATSDTREMVGAIVRMSVADHRASTMGTSPIPIPATDDVQERAQHAWMRWYALFGDTLAVGRRNYQIFGRPGLRGERLTIELRHDASPLRVHFDVGQHPLVHRVHFDVDGAVLELGGLAWADLPHAIAQLDTFIMERAAQHRPAKVETVTSEHRADVGRKEKPGSLQEEVGAALRALDLPADKYAHYRRQAEKAIALGKSYLPVVRRARRKAEQLRAVARPAASAPLAGLASPGASWVDRVVDNFNAEPGPRLAFARKRGAVTVFVVHAEDGTDAQALASIDVLHDEIDDVRWLDDGVAASAQEAIEERLERALEAAREDSPASTRPPLEGLIELMQRRGRELGVDPEQAARSGRTDEYARIAAILRELSDRTGTTAKELSDWLIGRGLHKAGDMVEEFSRDEGPVDKFVGWLWDELVDAIGVGEIVGKADGLYVPAEALFDRRDDTAVLLVREPVGRGRSLLRRVTVVVRDCEDDHEDAMCGIRVDDASERLDGGEGVWLRFESQESGFYRELLDRVHNFEDTVRRAPRTLQDVRILLYWTAAMIEAPRCQGDLKRAVLVALEEAKHYYDLAARRLAEGRDSDAVARMHEALRRISAAAAGLAQNCGEGQGALVLPTLPTRPEDQALFGEPTRGRRTTATGDRHGRDAAPDATASSRARPAQARLTTVAVAAGGRATRGSGLRPAPAAIPAGVQGLSSTRDVLACVGRLLWIESGGTMAGKIAMTKERLALLVQRATGSPEFPTLVNLNLPRIADRYSEGSMIGLIELDPVEVSLVGELTHVDQFLLESALHGAVRDAYLSVIPRGVRPTHRVGPGKGAWDGTASDAVGLSSNPTCTKCPFVLGANLDCDVCRRWILSLKRPGEPWTVEHLQEVIYRSCASTLVPRAALEALAETTEPPLTPEFFREFADGFARKLPTGLERAELDRCRSIVEYQFVQPEFPMPIHADAMAAGMPGGGSPARGHRTGMFTREERT